MTHETESEFKQGQIKPNYRIKINTKFRLSRALLSLFQVHHQEGTSLQASKLVWNYDPPSDRVTDGVKHVAASIVKS